MTCIQNFDDRADFRADGGIVEPRREAPPATGDVAYPVGEEPGILAAHRDLVVAALESECDRAAEAVVHLRDL
jgi:hypothetical protein